MTIRYLLRRAAFCGILTATLFGAGAASAAPDDVALLHDYLGVWEAPAKVTGPLGDFGNVICRLEFLDGSGDKVNFTGGCSFSLATITMTGTMAFIEATGNYESVMTTSVGFTGRAIGVRTENSVRFDLLGVTGEEEEVNKLAASASFTMADGIIDIGLSLVLRDTGDRYVASATFAR